MDINAAVTVFRTDPSACEDALRKFPSLISDKNQDHRTLLHLCAGFGIYPVCELLIKNGADVNAVDKWGETPIFRAIRFRKDDCFTLLLPLSKVNIKDTKGRTPLHRACATGTAFAVKSLLDSGADPADVDDDGKTALQLGEESQYSRGQIGIWTSKRILIGHYNECLKYPRAIETAMPRPKSRTAIDSKGKIIVEKDINGAQLKTPTRLSKMEYSNLISKENRERVEEHVSPLTESNQSPETVRKRTRLLQSPEAQSLHSPLKLEATIECDDGHFVSTPESKLIDNWLYKNSIVHRIQPKLTGTSTSCLFFLKAYNAYIVYVTRIQQINEYKALLGIDS